MFSVKRKPPFIPRLWYPMRKEFERFSNTKEQEIFTFKNPADLERWRIGSDQGNSDSGNSGNWCLTDSNTGLFVGKLQESCEKSWAILKTREYPKKWFHVRDKLDLDGFKFIQVKAKSDGNLYKHWKMNLKTVDFHATHVYSHPLEFTKRGDWEILEMKFRHFKLPDSIQGPVRKLEMNNSVIASVAFSVLLPESDTTDIKDYSLEIDWIKVINKPNTYN
jgi:hypothetical protein